MSSRLLSIMLAISILSLNLSNLTGCAGGSRGTGVHFNRSTDSSPLDDDEQDKKEKSWWK